MGIKFDKKILIVLIVPLVFFLSISDIINKCDISLSTFFIGKIFGSYTILEKKLYVFLVDNLYYMVIFNFFFGNYIYNELRENDVYKFTRIKNRKKWFLKKYLGLVIICFFYSVLLLFSNLVVSIMATGKSIDLETVSVFMRILFMIWGLLVVTSVSINLISINLNNTKAFFLVNSIIVILIFIAITGNENIPVLKESKLSFIINPVSGVIINSEDSPIFQYYIGIYYGVIAVVLFFFGRKKICKMDMNLIDREMSL